MIRSTQGLDYDYFPSYVVQDCRFFYTYVDILQLQVITNCIRKSISELGVKVHDLMKNNLSLAVAAHHERIRKLERTDDAECSEIYKEQLKLHNRVVQLDHVVNELEDRLSGFESAQFSLQTAESLAQHCSDYTEVWKVLKLVKRRQVRTHRQLRWISTQQQRGTNRKRTPARKIKTTRVATATTSSDTATQDLTGTASGMDNNTRAVVPPMPRNDNSDLALPPHYHFRRAYDHHDQVIDLMIIALLILAALRYESYTICLIAFVQALRFKCHHE